MNAKLLLPIILSVFLACFGWFGGIAHAQGYGYYTCYAPDGSYFDSVTPCGYYDYDYPYYDYGYPGFGYFEFNFGGHGGDFDRGERGEHGGGGFHGRHGR